MDKLQEARKIISEVDAQMAELFVRRMRAAEQVAEYKRERGLPIFDGAREKEVLEKGSARVEDPVLREHYVRFLQSSMDVSKDYQRQLLEGMKVAYSGTEGAFAHIAAGEIFQSARLVGYPNFAEAYRAVQEGACDCAVLPLENSSAGEVGQITDMMFDGSLYVNGVYELAVRHDLLALPGTALTDVKTVISHLPKDRCVLMGDFNMEPDDPILAPVRQALCDTAQAFSAPKLSFPSNAPTVKIDYILVSPDLRVCDADIPEIVSSDHRPHVATVETE
jgi:monofunctional chorismate mutase